jgi:hypothetical protein
LFLPALNCNIVHFVLALTAFNLGVHDVHRVDNTPTYHAGHPSTEHQPKRLAVVCDLFLILNPQLCFSEFVSPEVNGPTRNRAPN